MIIPADQNREACRTTSVQDGFWFRLSEMLDAYLATRIKKTIAAGTLRRSRHELARCRRLIHRLAVPARGRRRADQEPTNSPILKNDVHICAAFAWW
jgi:hypothetical protein